jgi:plastocyanin
MNKKALVAIIVIVVIVAVGGVVVAMNHNSDSGKSSTTSASTSSSMSGMDSSSMNSSSGSANTATATDSVTIDNFAFSPANITVKKGTSVTWTNKDSTTHTVTETDGKTGPDSGDLATGKSYSFTFNTVGTFKYHCSIHSDMTGTVTVTE